VRNGETEGVPFVAVWDPLTVASLIAALIAAIATILAVFIGYVLTHRSSQRLQQRQDELARVNRQLAELYGPLFVMIESGGVAFDAFCERYSLGVPNFDYDPKDLSRRRSPKSPRLVR
jgi:membrane protein YqaA with SNARE-associated domain